MRATGLLVGSLLLIGGGVSGCSTSEVLVPHAIELVSAKRPIPEAQLIDVGIRTFDPGVPEGEIDKKVAEELLEQRTFVHVRRAESIHMAVRLRDTMQNSGHWGALWVTPKLTTAADINVTAKILHSDGHIVDVHVSAVDTTGREWLDESYEIETAAGAYNRQRYPDIDPYQDLYKLIANDLAAVRRELSGSEVREIRTVAALRYASELSPAEFADYVATDGRGLYEPVRLPATDDPVFQRTRRVRQRERLFFETLNQHYDSFTSETASSYDHWREHAREESIAIGAATRRSRWHRVLGLAAMIGSMASIANGSGAGGSSFGNGFVRESMLFMSSGLFEMSAVDARERRLHRQALEELSTSFDDDIAPLVVEIAGVQHRLTGTIEAQYAAWRDLIRQLFVKENGVAPENVRIHTGSETQ